MGGGREGGRDRSVCAGDTDGHVWDTAMGNEDIGKGEREDG